MKSVDLSIVILNFNAGQLILDNLKLLQDTFSNDLTIEVIVADNASTDGSFEKIKKEFPKVITVDNRANIGFAAGNNRALSHSHGEFVAFVNPDIRIEDQEIWLKLLKVIQSDPRIGSLGVKVVFQNGRYDPDSMRGFPTPWNSFCHFVGLAKVFKGNYLFDSYHLGYLDPNQVHEVDALPGSFMIVRRQAGQDIGWWDEDYFFGGEDLEFSFQLKEKGWKVMYSSEVTVTHYKGATSGVRKESQHLTSATLSTKRRIAHELVEAMRIFYYKHYKNKYPFLVRWAVFKALDVLEKKRIAKYK